MLPERKNARLIGSVQSKEDGSQDSKPVSVNAMPLGLRNTMPIDVNSTMPVDVNTVSIAVNNTVTVVKDVCDRESDNRLECNADSKEILNENSRVT